MRLRNPLLIGAAALCLQCGARSRGNDFGERSKVDLSPIRFDGEGLALRRCSLDDECPADLCTTRQCSEGFCVEAISVTCPSHPNPCLANECQPETGECEAVNATPDEDGDGFYAPRPGFLPGEPLACGDDCDDSHPDSFPSGTEVCDGHDNDCDGSIDEGFSFLPPDAQAVLISDGAKEAGLGGLVHDGELFVLSYSRRDERNGSILRGMREARDVEFSSDVALTNSDSYAGPVRFTGSQLVTAWEDRREEDFEVFYNRFDRAGNKLGPDLRLSVAQDFSINPTIAVVGETHAVLWQDRRDAWLDFQIYGQRVGEKGELIGDNVHLSPEYIDAEAPSVAVGTQQLGLVFNTELSGRQIIFRTVSFDLSELGTAQVISRENSVGASISINDGRYMVLWHEYDVVPGDAIWGTVLDTTGSVLAGPARVTDQAEFARGHDVLPLGDRLILLWTEYADGSYDVFMRTLSNELTPIDDTLRVTRTNSDVLGVTAAIGNGRMGVAYTSYESGSPQVYFTTLACE